MLYHVAPGAQNWWSIVFGYFLRPQASSDPSNITNPCYPGGFNTTIMASAIYDTPCTKKPQNYSPNQTLFMVGSGNSDICETLVKSIFDFNSCSSPQCSFNGVEQPPVSGDFMVISLKGRGSEKQGWWEKRSPLFLPGVRGILLCGAGAADQRHFGDGGVLQFCQAVLSNTLGRGEFLTGRQINCCQGRGSKNFLYIMRQWHLLHYDTFNVALIFHNNSFIDV